MQQSTPDGFITETLPLFIKSDVFMPYIWYLFSPCHKNPSQKSNMQYYNAISPNVVHLNVFCFCSFFSLTLCLWATLLEFQKLATNYSVCCELVCWSPALQRSDRACARHCVLLCQICTGFRVCYGELSRISDSSPKEKVLLDTHLNRCSARLCQMYCRRIYFTFGPSVQAPITAVGSRRSGRSSRVYLFLLLLNVQYAHGSGSSGCTSVTQCIILK